jgi:MoxR-like ATPase
MEENIFSERTNLSQLQSAVDQLKAQMAKVLVGQNDMVELLLAAILADGHVLIEGVPGVAKTLTAKLLSRTINVQFSRIQFTPDLMPSDVIGTTIFNPKEVSFQFKQGPVFSNIVLIDEINRAPAKTQSALFEVMEERQITIDGKTYPMAYPFLVVATQNPIEQEGTYHLPEAQLDRFLFKINVDYPTQEDEIQVLRNHHQQALAAAVDSIVAVLNAGQLAELRLLVKNIRVEDKLLSFITSLVALTRKHKSIYLGASPRASIGIMNAAKSMAALQGRDFVTPEDILFVATPVLRHRVVITPEKEMEGGTVDQVIKELLQSVEVPR